MDIKSWILLIGSVLIIAVICHGFWTAYKARRDDMRMDIESDIPEDEDDLVLLRGELPTGVARVTPTVGFEALRADRTYLKSELADQDELPLDDVCAILEEGLPEQGAEAVEANSPDEGNRDAGYEPEQTSLDLEAAEIESGALEERYAERIAAQSRKPGPPAEKRRVAESAAADAPLLLEKELNPRTRAASPTGPSTTPSTTPSSSPPNSPSRSPSIAASGSAASVPAAELPPKKIVPPELVPEPRRKQFEPPLPEELAAIKAQEQLEANERAARAEQAAQQKARQRAERAALLAAKKTPEQPQLELAHDEPARPGEPVVEFPEAALRADPSARVGRAGRDQAKASRSTTANRQKSATQQKAPAAPPAGPPAPEELVVLNVITKEQPFHGGDVLELFLRNGIKFGDMNIFHRIDPVTKASQYSIASLTEPGYFDLSTMDSLEFRGLCLFMQLPCPGQATKVFTDMLTVADKLARQLDAEVCDEQFNRLTRQSTEHYRQRVAEFTRRHMSKRA